MLSFGWDPLKSQWIIVLDFRQICGDICVETAHAKHRHNLFTRNLNAKILKNQGLSALSWWWKHGSLIFIISKFDSTSSCTAYKFLCWADENCGPVGKWEKITEALEALQKNTTIGEFDLEERLAAAEQEKSFQNSVKIQTGSASCTLQFEFEFLVRFETQARKLTSNKSTTQSYMVFFKAAVWKKCSTVNFFEIAPFHFPIL